MEALFLKHARLRGALRVASVVAWLFAIGSTSAQTPEILAGKLEKAYAGLKSFSVKSRFESVWQDDFIRYRKQRGYSVPVWPSSHGFVDYFAREGLFGSEQKIWWGDGKLMADDRRLWDGIHWQALRRENPQRAWLEIARQRKGAHEVAVHAASPLERGFPFLIVAPQRFVGSEWPEDDHVWRVTLDKMHDKRAWQSFAQRVREKLTLVHHKDQLCWKFSVESGFARGTRSDKIHYRVWFPVDAPVFPVRIESWAVEKNLCLATTEVTEFFDPVELGSGTPLRFPKKIQYVSYTTDPLWLRKPYKTEDSEYTECAFNPAIPDEAFMIDYSLAAIVRHLDTGQTIQRKRGGQGN